MTASSIMMPLVHRQLIFLACMLLRQIQTADPDLLIHKRTRAETSSFSPRSLHGKRGSNSMETFFLPPDPDIQTVTFSNYVIILYCLSQICPTFSGVNQLIHLL